MDALIVDDSATVRKIIRRILEDLSFTCSEAEDGIFATEACRKKMPGLILLDWNMPNMNGLEFLKVLRAMEGGTSPKVIFCTTENSMDFIQNGIGAGADEYIMKPFDKTVIEAKLVQLGILQEKA
jgi:two-component system chemotaxis response regulator CheY